MLCQECKGQLSIHLLRRHLAYASSCQSGITLPALPGKVSPEIQPAFRREQARPANTSRLSSADSNSFLLRKLYTQHSPVQCQDGTPGAKWLDFCNDWKQSHENMQHCGCVWSSCCKTCTQWPWLQMPWGLACKCHASVYGSWQAARSSLDLPFDSWPRICHGCMVTQGHRLLLSLAWHHSNPMRQKIRSCEWCSGTTVSVSKLNIFACTWEWNVWTKVCNVQPALSSCRNFGWTCQSCPGLFLTHGQVGVAALDYLRLSGFLSIPHFRTNRLKMTPDCKHLLFRSDY